MVAILNYIKIMGCSWTKVQFIIYIEPYRRSPFSHECRSFCFEYESLLQRFPMYHKAIQLLISCQRSIWNSIYGCAWKKERKKNILDLKNSWKIRNIIWLEDWLEKDVVVMSLVTVRLFPFNSLNIFDFGRPNTCLKNSNWEVHSWIRQNLKFLNYAWVHD